MENGSSIKSPPRFVVIILVCFIGLVSSIFTGRVLRYEYEALNRMFSRYSLEDSGWPDLLLCILGLIVSAILCFGRIPKLSLGKASILTGISFAGGCLGILMAQVVSYNVFLDYGGYLGGVILCNLISRDFGL